MTQKKKEKNQTAVAPMLPVAFAQSEAELLYAMDRYILGNNVTRIRMGGRMDTLEALCGLYGDVTMLQVHYHLNMFRP